MSEMTPLRRRMIEDMTVRNLSPATQRSYVQAVAKFSRFFGRSPDQLDLEDVRAFQVHLVAGGILASMQAKWRGAKTCGAARPAASSMHVAAWPWAVHHHVPGRDIAAELGRSSRQSRPACWPAQTRHDFQP